MLTRMSEFLRSRAPSNHWSRCCRSTNRAMTPASLLWFRRWQAAKSCSDASPTPRCFFANSTHALLVSPSSSLASTKFIAQVLLILNTFLSPTGIKSVWIFQLLYLMVYYLISAIRGAELACTHISNIICIKNFSIFLFLWPPPPPPTHPNHPPHPPPPCLCALINLYKQFHGAYHT